uniref:Uncharacterized protein n=1 Tax=Brassica oleracea TaxID=3712 RepID=A0A3P6EBG7_BRAOL|nr:unnamed protein product [Brassica oleracea]
MPSAIFIQSFATSGLLNNMPQSAILVPALQSQRVNDARKYDDIRLWLPVMDHYYQ